MRYNKVIRFLPSNGFIPLLWFAFFVNMRKYHYICNRQSAEVMEIVFNEEYLREMYVTGKTDKKHRFQPQIIRKYIRVIDLMKNTDNTLGLCRYNSLNYEKLIGDKVGLSSVRVNDRYRIEFEEYIRDGETVATICNITELSNHSK